MMTKRMTAEEVADKLERLVTVWRSVNVDRSIAHKEAACYVRDNLVPQWQDEPDEESWCWVEGVEFPVYVHRTDWQDVEDNGTWSVTGFSHDSGGEDYRPLAGRRVCPIGARPR